MLYKKKICQKREPATISRTAESKRAILYIGRMQRAPFEKRRKNHDWRPTMESPMGNIGEKIR
jgi:hypothetical protein